MHWSKSHLRAEHFESMADYCTVNFKKIGFIEFLKNQLPKTTFNSNVQT